MRYSCCGCLPLGSLSRNLQCFYDTRVVVFGPSNCSPQAKRASILLECGPSVHRITFAGPSAPQCHSSMSSEFASQFCRDSSAIMLISYGLSFPDFSHLRPAAPLHCSSGGSFSSQNFFLRLIYSYLPKIWWQYISSDAVCQI
jgi:hypothetical protein